jgi:hypothetical protein
LGIGIGTIGHWHRGETVIRALGGVILVGGVVFLWRALT